MTLYLLTAGAIILCLLNLISTPSKQGVKVCFALGAIVCLYTAFTALLLLFGLTGRLLSGFGIGVVLALFLWSGNKLKVTVLKEVLVFSDIFLLGHAIKHPRLYFGYAPKWVGFFVLVVMGVLIYALRLETPYFSLSERIYCVGAGLTLITFLCLIAFFADRIPNRIFDNLKLQFKANDDAARYTPCGAALLHTFWHMRNKVKLQKKFEAAQKLSFETPVSVEAQQNTDFHHVILIQAESFCRLRNKNTSSSPTPTIDSMAQSAPNGEFCLDWQGAYTMRTEFSVLTGQNVSEYETYAFDPYRLCSFAKGESLATKFKSLGYKTVAWHPHAAEFFSRNEVFPNLGFDVFCSENAFTILKGKDLYITDQDLLEHAIRFLAQAKQPVFLFIVTMEAHGPWNNLKDSSGKLVAEEDCYLFHQKSLDKGMASVKSAIQRGLISATVGFYGDHLPALRNTDLLPKGPFWMIWNGKKYCPSQTLNPEQFSKIFFGVSHD